LEDWRKGPMGLAAAQQAFTRSNASDTALPPLPEVSFAVDMISTLKQLESSNIK